MAKPGTLACLLTEPEVTEGVVMIYITLLKKQGREKGRGKGRRKKGEGGKLHTVNAMKAITCKS